MKVTLYNAISIDGYIAGKDDDTDWVSDTDWGIFDSMVKRYDAVVMGRRTYQDMDDDFPLECDLNIVMTSNPENYESSERVIFTDKSPTEIIDQVKSLGIEKVLIIGGGITNASYLKEKLIHEIIVDIHPIILSEGTKLFEGNQKASLQLISIDEKQEDLLLVTYSVNY